MPRHLEGQLPPGRFPRRAAQRVMADLADALIPSEGRPGPNPNSWRHVANGRISRRGNPHADFRTVRVAYESPPR